MKWEETVAQSKVLSYESPILSNSYVPHNLVECSSPAVLPTYCSCLHKHTKHNRPSPPNLLQVLNLASPVKAFLDYDPRSPVWPTQRLDHICQHQYHGRTARLRLYSSIVCFGADKTNPSISEVSPLLLARMTPPQKSAVMSLQTA